MRILYLPIFLFRFFRRSVAGQVNEKKAPSAYENRFALTENFQN
ncbi:hypothetical protein CAEBREN_02545 [Caenorhabditis brenneri]|uniref:Uncharacterized protein n=1 Tax=Caenorhabditis brenneri TaxID=135651 RepID=G0NP85_CAEBE|nr:hypothetical protein CAEBREN_02545 [Caenorhabditis brenneri]